MNKKSLQIEISGLIEQHGGARQSLLPLLQSLQKKYRILSPEMLQEAAFLLDLSPVEVESVASFYKFAAVNRKLGKYVLRICHSLSCDMKNKNALLELLKNEYDLLPGQTRGDFTLEETSCLGMCDQGPSVLINEFAVSEISPEKLREILKKPENLKSHIPNSTVVIKGPLLGHSVVSPGPLKCALEKGPDFVLEEIKNSGLRGRGGAGFPTELKWEMARSFPGKKYVVCNADEGEPGTFKDRYLLHEELDMVLEGMTLAAFAVGSEKGFIYLRAEYEYLRKFIEDRIIQRKGQSLLGKNILKSSFHFEIELRMGWGAYICGEETALLESLEGKRGEPRSKPPFPVEKGFLNSPTIVNNVETFAHAAFILGRGSEWFKKNGTEKSTGTKLFSVSGDCGLPGIYELPFGITIAELLNKCGGKDARWVQVGGPSGFCIKRDDFSHRLAFEDIPTGGSVIVINEKRQLIDIAVNFMEFFSEESCGQCLPCREGNPALLSALKELKKGDSTRTEKIKSLGRAVQLTSRCGLGQSSPNALISILEILHEK